MEKAKRYRKIIAAVVAVVCLSGIVVIYGKFQTYSYTFECTTCHQHWQTSHTTLWGVPVWRSSESHLTNTHQPTYTHGGFSRETWTILGGTRFIACGGHSLHSP